MARKKRRLKDEINDGLRQLAFGDVQDCLFLLFSSEEEICSRLDSLNLMNISEIKRPRGGGMEIKFYDRIKALERLAGAQADKADEPHSFYTALQQGAKNIEQVFEEGSDE